MAMLSSADQWQKIISAIHSSHSVGITSHIHPDPDNVGSCLALCHGLNQLGKAAKVVLADAVPSHVQFLVGAEEVICVGRDQTTISSLGFDFDTVVVLDCEPGRTGGLLSEIPPGIKVINIDHHLSNRGDGDLTLVDPEAAATGELVARLLDQSGVALTLEIAECLMTAIVGDTGSFAYSSTSPDTHRLAARLVEVGVSTEKIHQALYETFAWGYAELLCKALGHLRRSADGKISWLEIPLELSEEMNLQGQDSEAFIRYARMIQGVEVAVLMREIEPGRTKVSLRSRGGVDVSRVAESLGGGGHRKAAGCTLADELGPAKERVLAAIGEVLESSTT